MDVAVIGGGLAGLAAAYELSNSGLEVSLFEASDRVGGQISTVREGKFVVELGADSLVTPDREIRKFLSEIGVVDRLVSQSGLSSLVLEEQSLKTLPQGAAAEMLGLGGDETLRGKGVVAFETGMADLVEKLLDRLRPTQLNLGTTVTAIAPNGHGWAVRSGSEDLVTPSAVILATPPQVTAALLGRADHSLGLSFPTVPSLSSVTISLAFRQAAVGHSLDATGYVIPGQSRETPGFKACTFTSSKFPNRCPDGYVLLRAFYRPGNACPIDEADSVWIDRASAEIESVLDLAEPPTSGWVSRWPEAIYRMSNDIVQHITCVADRVRKLGNIELAGAGVQGAGVHRALDSGRRTASRLMDQL